MRLTLGVPSDARYSSSTHTNFLLTSRWKLTSLMCAVRLSHVITLILHAIYGVFFYHKYDS